MTNTPQAGSVADRLAYVITWLEGGCDPKQAAAELRAIATQSRQPIAEGAATVAYPEGYALVPLRMTQEMNAVIAEEGWQWEDLLAAASAITLEQYDEIAATPAAGAGGSVGAMTVIAGHQRRSRK